MFCFIRVYGRRRTWRTMVWPTRWTPFPIGLVHTWLIWPACVWSVYGQVAAETAVWLLCGCLGHLMVGLVCLGSVALLPVVAQSNVVCVAGMSASLLVSCVFVCPSVVQCSWLMLVGCARNGRVAVFCCVRGYGGRWVSRTTVSPTRRTPFPSRPMNAVLVWCWPACVWSVDGHVVAAATVLLVHGCLSHPMVRLLGVVSLALQRALARSNVIRVVVMPVLVLVGCARVSLCTTRRVTSPVVVWRRVDAVS